MNDSEERRCFSKIATTVRDARERTFPEGRSKPLSQSELSELLGYKNGQFISNIERGLCSVPAKKIPAVCSILGISTEEVLRAMVQDYEEHLILSLREGGENVQVNRQPITDGEGVYFN